MPQLVLEFDITKFVKNKVFTNNDNCSCHAGRRLQASLRSIALYPIPRYLSSKILLLIMIATSHSIWREINLMSCTSESWIEDRTINSGTGNYRPSENRTWVIRWRTTLRVVQKFQRRRSGWNLGRWLKFQLPRRHQVSVSSTQHKREEFGSGTISKIFKYPYISSHIPRSKITTCIFLEYFEIYAGESY
jgi:hypothetical protein